MVSAKTRLRGRRSLRGSEFCCCDTFLIHPRLSPAFMIHSEPSIFIFTLGLVCQVQAASWQYVWIFCRFSVKLSLNLARVLSQSICHDISSGVARVWFFQYSHLSSHFCLNSHSVRRLFILIHICKKISIVYTGSSIGSNTGKWACLFSVRVP